MALHFSMEVECGSEPAAHIVAAHFRGLSLRAEGTTLACRANVSRDSENNWWASVAPPGTSLGLPGYDNPRLQKAAVLSEIGHLLYDRLRTARGFRYALAGVEASEFRYFDELDTNVLTVPGLVLTHELWQKLGNDTAFEPFSDGYFWRPYMGEKRDL